MNIVKKIGSIFRKKQSKDIIPTTLYGAIEQLYSELPRASIDYIKTHEDSSGIHFTSGMALRNSWNLWDTKSPLNKDIQTKYGLYGHGDDVSGIIYAGLWARVKNDNVDKAMQEAADSYIKHWSEMGINPKTGESCDEKNQSLNYIYEVTGNKPKVTLIESETHQPSPHA